jgi:hypothetical protein
MPKYNIVLFLIPNLPTKYINDNFWKNLGDSKGGDFLGTLLTYV